MNIYRRKYRGVKDRLLVFGARFFSTSRHSLYSFVFWKECHRREKAMASWDYVITEYLAYECDGEQRRFIDLVFFRRRSVSYVSCEMNLSERMYYNWSETVLSDLTGLAMQAGLTKIDLKKDIEVCAYELSDEKWREIESEVFTETKCKTKDLRRDVEAMIFTVTTGIRWRSLPKIYGPWKTVCNKFRSWVKTGLWAKIAALLGIDR